MVGFTSFAERTDPEVVARIVDAAFRQLAEVVVEHGGTVDKYMGDSMMAVFGVPVAHDDDAERAVAAGLAVRALGGDLAFSIGINSGEVMATTVGPTGNITVIGDTVNASSRLQDLTRVLDTPLVAGDALVQAVGTHEGAAPMLQRLRPAGERQLRGRVGAIKVWTLAPEVAP